MAQILQNDLLLGGWFNLLLCATTLVAWSYGLFCLASGTWCRALEMVELIWLIAPLRACLNTIFAVQMITTTDAGSSSIMLNLWSLNIALTLPLLEASILATIMLIPVIFSVRHHDQLKFHCIGGILAAVGAVVVSHFTLVALLLYKP